MYRVQHKSKRESNKLQELQELRQENNKLKKQVSRLRKTIDKFGSIPDEDPTPTDTSPEPIINANRCPKCNSDNIGSWTSPGGKVLLGCRACKRWQERRAA